MTAPAYRHCTREGCSSANARTVLSGEAASATAAGPASFAYTFRHCTACGLGFVEPLPSPEILAGLYGPDYAYYAPAGEHPRREQGSWKYRLAAGRYRQLLVPSAANRALALLARLAEGLSRRTITLTLGVPLALPRTARLLDYGYGSGSWLTAMSLRGYTRLAGYDIAANPGHAAMLAAHGVEVLSAPALAAAAAASFDCIRLEHVFEHLHDPPMVLAELRRLLAGGGRLVMTFPTIYPWLPVDGLPGSPFLPHLQLPIHLAHHSIESATRLLRRAGFTIAALRLTRRERFLTLMAVKDGAP